MVTELIFGSCLRDAQPLNASFPISVTVFGSITFSTALASFRIPTGTFVIPSSNTTFFNEVHPENGPIDKFSFSFVTVFGMLISVKEAQFWKAP